MPRPFPAIFSRPSEFLALIQMLLKGPKPANSKQDLGELAAELDDFSFCYATLDRVSRSFAAVIQQLPDDLKDAVCIYYLVLRGLDSVEDDMDMEEGRKRALLLSFADRLKEPDWNLHGIGDTEDYRHLLANFHKVIGAYQSLDESYQIIIWNSCADMASGMVEFGDRPVQTMSDYDQYCHYVAGLVGYGLSDLFAGSGLEDEALSSQRTLSNHMGLFLQKTNIIRDFREDTLAGRNFWPLEVLKNATQNSAQSLSELNFPVESLNTLVADALGHVSDCLDYLAMLRNQRIFRFCAIPQAMAIATLAELYDNSEVFQRPVKIRKGMAARIMLRTRTMEDIRREYRRAIQIILSKARKNGDAVTEGRALAALQLAIA